jgi:hypothetical protein
MAPGDLISAAAWNNAALCNGVCRAHGISAHFGDGAWTSPRRTPPLYPDAVTLARHVTPESVLARVDPSTGCSIKDSFSALSLGAHGFNVLFEAQWIVRWPDQPGSRRDPDVVELAWRRVQDARELARWEERGRDEGVVGSSPASLLTAGLVFLAAYDGDSLVAGAIANRANGVVGVSNVFAGPKSRSQLWPGCIRAVSERFPGLPIVGYESGAALRDAVGQGFHPVAPLRVWLRDGESPAVHAAEQGRHVR